ncbi:TetR-like C-terminal domain-containing protein [Bosea sp. AS-1]|jgi:AcrR family transcriptional regulator|uniref:TetR/AcrR family transcriptional regulator n=1 Tax=Bosea sp. AS-1 TaxID=2015316 RepID=UPI000B78D84B|nr:TetR-like C-terminal domain-containing protein [Bosea sp. AS-1]
MSETQRRREEQRQALIAAAERAIAAQGLAGLKARELASEVGCSLGAIYNLVQDMDELVLRVGSRTLSRLDVALTEVESGPEGAVERLVAIALAYCRFARANLHLWRTLFDHRMAEGSEVPDWAVSEQMQLFRHIAVPLSELLPNAGGDRLTLLTRTLFSAVHGVLVLGLDEKLIAVPVAALEQQIDMLVRLVCAGLGSEESR